MEEIKQQRIHILDELRGFAIICMVFHHAFYDVGSLLGYQWGYDLFNWFKVMPPLFCFLFIVISVICSCLSRSSLRRGILVE
ncbi:MAG: DUF1624 domain-containing protein, partial [Clostridiales bacterium]|nr:DUF1624 domain-containing protein [Clostridiales bacterium]